MKIMKTALLATASGLLFLACVSTPASARARKPVPKDPALMATMLMYPVVDLRKEPKPELSSCELAKPVNPEFFHSVNGKVSFAADGGLNIDLTTAQIASMGADALKSIRKNDEQYIVLTSVTEFRYRGASLTYNIDSSVIRADSGAIVWKHANKGRKWLGVLGGALDSATDNVAHQTKCEFLNLTIRKTFTAMPELVKY